jgi:hypothetical protein
VGLLAPANLGIEGAEAAVAVGLERAHGELLGQHQRLPLARLGLLDVRWVGLGVDGTKLELRMRLYSTCLPLPGQVERLTGMLPGLVELSGAKIDHAELPEKAPGHFRGE